MYSIIDRKSFERLEDLFQSIKERNELSNVVLVANKTDQYMNAVVTEEEGKQFAKNKGILFFSISCKTGFGIDDVLENILSQIEQ